MESKYNYNYKDEDDEDDYAYKNSNDSKSSKLNEVDDENKYEGNIVEKVSNFFYGNDEFANFFENWVNSQCDVIDLDSEEMKLEYTHIYNEFKNLYESKIEEFIISQKSSVIEFYQEVKKSLEEDPMSYEATLSQIILAASDFDIFMQMMREAKQSSLKSRK